VDYLVDGLDNQVMTPGGSINMNSSTPDHITTAAGLVAAIAHAASCAGVFPGFFGPAGAIATAVWAFYTNHATPPKRDR